MSQALNVFFTENWFKFICYICIRYTDFWLILYDFYNISNDACLVDMEWMTGTGQTEGEAPEGMIYFLYASVIAQ